MRERSPFRRRVGSTAVDVALTGALLLIPALSFAYARDVRHLPDVALILPLVLRRRRPVAMFTLVCLGLLVQAIAFDTPRYGDVALLIALHAVASYGPPWAAWAGLATGFLGALVAAIRWTYGTQSVSATIAYVITLSALVFAAWILGYLARTRRAYVAGLEQRAAQLERDAAQQAQIATAAERARIAREMHDVVAHSLSVMVVQADGALYAARQRPEVATETLRTISSTGRASLTEMRKLLGLLRDDDAGQSLAPLPAATDVADLVDQLRASGLSIDLCVTGELERVDPTTGLTVYRIVQEALTNTLKHGGPAVQAVVDLRVTTEAVRIRVDDDGRGSTAGDGHGHGLVGMRERIALHEGHVEASPRPGGGFRVQASVPLGSPT